jgi:hypothetical protein
MRLDWRRGILYITTMGMEGAWLYTLIALLNRQVADSRLSTLGLLLLFPVAFAVDLLLRQLRWRRLALRALSWLIWGVAALVTVKLQLFGSVAWLDSTWLQAVSQAFAQMLFGFAPALLVLIISGILWWLGRRLAYLRPNFASSVAEFQFGMAILLILFYIMSQLGLDLADSVPTAISFFLFALLGMSLAHAQEGSGWLTGMYRGHWSALLIMSLGLVLVAGSLITVVVTPDFLQLVLNAIRWVWGLIWAVVVAVLTFLVNLLPKPEPGELPPATPLPAGEPEAGFSINMPEWLRSALRLGLNILWLGLIIAALWQISSQIFGWLRRRLSSMAGAEVEPLPGAFRADLFRWLRNVFLKLFGFRHWRPGKKDRALLPEVASVHQIYRQFLRWAAAGGYPRPVWQTPYEFLGALLPVLPQTQDDLVFITQQYVSTRYGGLLPTQDDLHQLRQSWHNISQNRITRSAG